ncbi:hypothetical protein AsFPU3_1277 [Aphanothece sacrum FPU3]|nr:hypothetical protein AsFPU3_1277 [Aphanothece sacrum FPU3]
MARSNRVNSDIEVRFTHRPIITEEVLHQNQYNRHINAQGLVMILPFTEFNGGSSWELRCCGDVMSEFLGDTWQESLILNILETPVQIKNEQPEDKPQEVSVSIADSSNPQAQYYLEKLKQLLREQIEPKLTKTNECLEVSLDQKEEDKICFINLKLEKTKLTRDKGQPLTVSGRIEATDTQADLALTGKICYQLKHPETEEIVLTVEAVLYDEKLPYYFEQILMISEEKEAENLSGEVRLEAMTGVVINQDSFTLNTNEYNSVNYTIELLSTEDKTSYIFDIELPQKVTAFPATIELPKPSKIRQPLVSSFASSRQVLPPKLKPGKTDVNQDKKSLKLPQIYYEQMSSF